MKKLKIQIIGTVGSGKTTIAKKIEQILNTYGISTTVKDDYYDKVSPEQAYLNLRCMHGDLEVEIETVQCHRNGLEG